MGLFDGQGNKVFGLKTDDPADPYRGLFGSVTGSIQNLTVCESPDSPVIPPVDPSELSGGLWDGKTVDVSWYFGHESDKTYVLDSAPAMAGAAALVNGLVNSNCVVCTGTQTLTAEEWNNSSYVLNGSGTHGSCNRATDDYSYGGENFRGKTLLLEEDLDMSAGNYMPIGGQYLMDDEDTDTKISSSFCGIFDGQGHNVILECDRHCTLNYGDGASVGLIGRLGVHDNDPENWRPVNPVVRNVAVYGNVYANRSVGGVVGKIGRTAGFATSEANEKGALIENCANFASVMGTDAKGTGGIAGAGWNGGILRNCYNAGNVKNTHNAYGGLVGSNEILIRNSYNRGIVTGVGTSAAIATDGGGGPYEHVYWLNLSADMGVFSSGKDLLGSDACKTSAEMKDPSFLALLGDAFTEDTENINDGYPILKWQAVEETDPPEDHVPNCPGREYSDLDTNQWYHEAIDCVLLKNYFNGVGGGKFDPDGTMTRAMFVTVLSRMEGIDGAQYSGSSFTDVEAGQWYSAAIEWASRNGIVLGAGDGRFAPDSRVTREQMAVIMYRYADFRKFGTSAADESAFEAFTDKELVSGWAKDAMIWAASEGLINGMGDNTLAPQAQSTRAQVAQIVMNYDKKFG